MSRVLRALNFAWGVKPRLNEQSGKNHMEAVEDYLEACPDFDKGDTLVITAGRPTPGNPAPGTNEIKIYTK